MKSYSGMTSVLRIPYPSGNDAITEENERHVARILENLLLGGLEGVRNAFFVEGSYVVKEEPDYFSLILVSTGSMRGGTGLVGGRYFSFDTVSWRVKKTPGMCYLYLSKGSDIDVDPTSVSTFSSWAKISSEESLLCVEVKIDNDLRITTDTSPVGKYFSRNLKGHVDDNVNPHGEELIQDKIITKECQSDRFYCSQKGDTPALESSNEMILKDKRVSVQMSDSENSSLNYGRSIIGTLNYCLKEISDIKQGIGL